MDPSVNWLAVIVATFLCFGLGALWYGPLFGTAWMEESRIPEEDVRVRPSGMIYGTAFALTFIIVANLAFFLGQSSVTEGALYGFLTGFGWIAMAFGITYLFSNNSLKLWAIDSFYYVVGLTLAGIILTAWP